MTKLSPHQGFALLFLSMGFLSCLFAEMSWSYRDELKVSFLDIGQGDAILIQTPHDRHILIDGGPGTTILERLSETTSFWLRTIDLLILTHPHQDHMEGLIEILDRYHVKQVMMTGVEYPSAIHEAFLTRLEAMNTPVTLVNPEEDWQLDDGVFLDILWPEKPFGEYENVNDSSIVAKLIYGTTELLLTGDMELEAEHELLLTDTDLRSDFLKAGHHGSRTSSSLELLRASQVRQAVMMNAKDNTFNHPHLDTLLHFDDRGIEWWSTKDVGTITIESDGNTWHRSILSL